MHRTDRPGSALAILIVCFCLWHMFAVAVYLLPTKDDTLVKSIRGIGVPYVLALGQWQKWDIFSPNPIRRNSEYRIERNAGDRYETAMILDFAHLPWYQRAKELKVLGRLQEGWKAALPDYLLSLCPRIPDGQGSDVRLLVKTTILPKDLYSLKRQSESVHTPDETLLASVRCPRF